VTEHDLRYPLASTAFLCFRGVLGHPLENCVRVVAWQIGAEKT
jgi:hypothetical protein